MKSVLRDGTIIETYDGEGKTIEFLYGNALGRGVLALLIQPWVSHMAGVFLDSRISRFLVRSFVKKNNLDLRDYPVRRYQSFNDFFTRKIIPANRPIDQDKSHMISPCDGKMTVFPLDEEKRFCIKGCDYTLKSLLRNEKLSDCYKGGWGILLRLTVDDYHRYIYPVSGRKTKNHRIPGVYHTVNPRAAKARRIYQENTREYTVIDSKEFGKVLMMEIGAMLVGRICNHHEACVIERGQEKGHFEFGGSSIILLMEPGRYKPDSDILENSENGLETVIKQGEHIGFGDVSFATRSAH